MATRVSIPRHFVYSVISVNDSRTSSLVGPPKKWLKEQQIDETTGYTLVFHDDAFHIDFTNLNDAIRFRLVMTEWKEIPWPFDVGAYYAPYVPLYSTLLSQQITIKGQTILNVLTKSVKEADTDDELTS